MNEAQHTVLGLLLNSRIKIDPLKFRHLLLVMNRAYITPLGLTSQFSFCGLPLRLDTYAGCAISCSYCFARLRGGNAQTNKIRYADPDSVITRFQNAFSKPEVATGVVAELVRNKTPLHFG